MRPTIRPKISAKVTDHLRDILGMGCLLPWRVDASDVGQRGLTKKFAGIWQLIMMGHHGSTTITIQ